jgi:hypothetical protein
MKVKENLKNRVSAGRDRGLGRGGRLVPIFNSTRLHWQLPLLRNTYGVTINAF